MLDSHSGRAAELGTMKTLPHGAGLERRDY